MIDKITCPLCMCEFKSLNSHIIHKHGMKIEQFLELFPMQPLVSEATKNLTSETSKKNGVGIWRKGKKLTIEQRKNCSKRMLGKLNPFFGKKHSFEAREKMKANHYDVSGDNNPFRNSMKNSQFKLNYLQRRKIALEECKKKDPEKYAIKCDNMSKTTTRLIMENKIFSYGRGHKMGWYQSAKAVDKIFYRSSYELMFLTLCDANDLIKTISQPKFSIQYSDELQHKRRYIPDFIINDNVVVEIKAKFQLDNKRIQLKHASAELYCSDNSMQFIVITHPIEEQFKLFVQKIG